MTRVVQDGVKISGSIASLTEKVVNLESARSLSVYAKYTKADESGKTFVVASTTLETLTVTAHGWATGRKVQATNSGGALPTGIAAATDHFVVVVDANTIKLSASLAGAIAGTGIRDVSTAGTGTNTLTPVALAGGVFNIYETDDSDPLTTEWTAMASQTVAISATGKSVFKPNADSRQIKLSYDMTAGQLDVVCTICAKD